jgi:hypothetical protein
MRPLCAHAAWCTRRTSRFKEYVAGLFNGPVDVNLKPHLRAPAARDAV